MARKYRTAKRLNSSVSSPGTSGTPKTDATPSQTSRKGPTLAEIKDRDNNEQESPISSKNDKLLDSGDDLHSASSTIASQCMAVILDYCKKSERDAKEALRKLAEAHPASSLPHRFLARLLYHEASSLMEEDGNDVTGDGRLNLLGQALDHAKRATSLCPNSLSSAVLRATLVVTKLVENSTLISRKGKVKTRIPTESQCEEIQQEFRDAVKMCGQALNSESILVNEPAIYISTGSHWTFDPCSLRIQDKMLPMVRDGRWEDVVAEKKRVLNCMQQVLESCHTLLDSTQIPVDGIVRLLLHILRPHQQELQLWAGQLLPGRTRALQELHRKFEAHQAVADLLSALKPGESDCGKSEESNDKEPLAHDTTLSIDRDWDYGWEEGVKSSVRRRKNQRRGRRTQTAQKGPTLRERYMDVEGFWKKASTDRKRQLLRVPLISLLEEVQQDQGMEGAEDMADSLMVLKKQGSQRACYWTCTVCKQNFQTSKDYLNHVELFHEELAVVENNYVHCSKCQKEIVGIYHSSPNGDGRVMCVGCYHRHRESICSGQDAQPFQKVFPQSPSGVRGWSDASDDALSTQESSSFDGEYIPSPRGSANLSSLEIETDGTNPPTHWNQISPTSTMKNAQGEETLSDCIQQAAGPSDASVDSPVQIQDLLAALMKEAQKLDSALDGLVDPADPPLMTDSPSENAGDGDNSEQSELDRESKGRGWKGWWPKRLTFNLGRSSSSKQQEEEKSTESGENEQGDDEGVVEELELDLGDDDFQACTSDGLSEGQNFDPPHRSTSNSDRDVSGESEQQDSTSHLRFGAYEGLKEDQLDREEDAKSEGEEEVSRGRDQMIERIFHKMHDVWHADRVAGDIVIGNISHYIQRKIICMLEEEHMDDDTKEEVHQAMESFIEQPHMVFQKSGSLRAVLNCLAFRELQNIIVYLLRQQQDTMSVDGQEMYDACSSSGFLEGDDSVEEEEEEEEEEVDNLAGCLSLFEISPVLDEAVLDRSLELLWEREDMQHRQPARNSKQCKEDEEGSSEGSVDQKDAYLDVQVWWLEHLLHKGMSEGQSYVEAWSRVLKWAYGGVVNSSMERFAEHQRELRDGKERDVVVLELYNQTAEKWRHLQGYTDKRNRLDELRKNAKSRFDLVQTLSEDPKTCTKEQACSFLDAVMQSCGSQSPSKGQPVLHTSKLVVDTVRKNLQLTQEPSHRYARALLERDLAVLQLVEAMLRHVSEEAKRERERTDEQLKKLTRELRDAETELQRVEAEGPANHRRRDILDKATKEAEHREKLQSLKQRILVGKERIASEESACLKWQQKLQDARKDLTTVKEWLRQHTTRNKNLDEICARLELPSNRSNEAGSSSPNARSAEKMEYLMYRVLWVSEAIKMFDERYSPQTGGKPYQLFTKAAKWAKQLTLQYEGQIRLCFNDLDELRQKLQMVACVDQARDICNACLEVIRKQIEQAATEAREKASESLLRELEEEEKIKKGLQEGKADAPKPKKKRSKRQRAEKALKEKAEREKQQQEELARQAREDKKRKAEEEKQRIEQARQEMMARHEAELEKRRKELEELEVEREKALARQLDTPKHDHHARRKKQDHQQVHSNAQKSGRKFDVHPQLNGKVIPVVVQKAGMESMDKQPQKKIALSAGNSGKSSSAVVEHGAVNGKVAHVSHASKGAGSPPGGVGGAAKVTVDDGKHRQGVKPTQEKGREAPAVHAAPSTSSGAPKLWNARNMHAPAVGAMNAVAKGEISTQITTTSVSKGNLNVGQAVVNNPVGNKRKPEARAMPQQSRDGKESVANKSTHTQATPTGPPIKKPVPMSDEQPAAASRPALLHTSPAELMTPPPSVSKPPSNTPTPDTRAKSISPVATPKLASPTPTPQENDLPPPVVKAVKVVDAVGASSVRENSIGGSFLNAVVPMKQESVRWCAGGVINPSQDPVWQQVLAQARGTGQTGSGGNNAAAFPLNLGDAEPLSRHESFLKSPRPAFSFQSGQQAGGPNRVDQGDVDWMLPREFASYAMDSNFPASNVEDFRPRFTSLEAPPAIPHFHALTQGYSTFNGAVRNGNVSSDAYRGGGLSGYGQHVQAMSMSGGPAMPPPPMTGPYYSTPEPSGTFQPFELSLGDSGKGRESVMGTKESAGNLLHSGGYSSRPGWTTSSTESVMQKPGGGQYGGGYWNPQCEYTERHGPGGYWGNGK